MALYGSALEDLQKLLTGAMVLEVKPTSLGDGESIALFRVEREGKKYSFVLGATDLGSWVSHKVVEKPRKPKAPTPG